MRRGRGLVVEGQQLKDLSEVREVLTERIDEWEENLREQGRHVQQLHAVQLVLRARFPEHREPWEEQLAELTLEHLEALLEVALQAQAVDEVREWLSQRNAAG